jgi:hypothetical protein
VSLWLKGGLSNSFLYTDVTRADAAQAAKPARSQENAVFPGRFGNLRYGDGA